MGYTLYEFVLEPLHESALRRFDEGARDLFCVEVTDQLLRYVAGKVSRQALRFMFGDVLREAGEVSHRPSGRDGAAGVSFTLSLRDSFFFAGHWTTAAYAACVPALDRAARAEGMRLVHPARAEPETRSRGVGYVFDGKQLYEAYRGSDEGNLIRLDGSQIASRLFLFGELPAAAQEAMRQAWEAAECRCPLCAALLRERERARARASQRPAPRPPEEQAAWLREKEALLEALAAAPADDALRAGLAARLLEAGDPLGELIQLQGEAERGSAGVVASARIRKLRKRVAKELLGPLATLTAAASVGFRRGFPSRLSTFASTKKLLATAGHRAWATIEQLSVTYLAKHPLPYELIAHPVMRSLVRVEGITWETLGRLLADGHDRPLAEVVLRKSLAGALSEATVAAMRTGTGLPRLRALELVDLAPAELAWLWDGALLPSLERLVVHDETPDVALSAWLTRLRARGGRLSELELRWGWVGNLVRLRRQATWDAIALTLAVYSEHDHEELDRELPALLDELRALPPGAAREVALPSEPASIRAQILAALSSQPDLTVSEPEDE